MISSLVLWTIVSLILIILIHYLFTFFKDTLTVPKVKDLIEQPLQSYKDMEKLLILANNNEPQTTNNDIDPKVMKDELKAFFSELKENKAIFSLPENIEQNQISMK